MFAIFMSVGSSHLPIDFWKICWRMGADSYVVSFIKWVERASRPAALFGFSFWSNLTYTISLLSMVSQPISRIVFLSGLILSIVNTELN